MKFAILTIALIALAGCIDPPQEGDSMDSGQSGSAATEQSVAVAGQGQVSGSETRTLECPASAEVEVGIQGQGGIDVTVTDGNGDEVYSKSFDGQGQTADSKTPSGAAGTWTLEVEFSGSIYYPQGFQGQYGIYVRC